ncbi:type IV pilus biogenesis protein PilP, partial [Rhodobacter sp. 140A]
STSAVASAASSSAASSLAVSSSASAISSAASAPQKAAPAAPQRSVATAPEPAVELDEPEPTLPTKRMPTSASVAKQATEQNALALREMNLIGVYGASGNRRALIRMPNGRFVKVAVGDRLDGGRVTAIGDGQLSYQKGSRTLMLKMLKGS